MSGGGLTGGIVGVAGGGGGLMGGIVGAVGGDGLGGGVMMGPLGTVGVAIGPGGATVGRGDTVGTGGGLSGGSVGIGETSPGLMIGGTGCGVGVGGQVRSFPHTGSVGVCKQTPFGPSQTQGGAVGAEMLPIRLRGSGDTVGAGIGGAASVSAGVPPAVAISWPAALATAQHARVQTLSLRFSREIPIAR